jgi:uncharacterized repeat protein (TIGR01451 family)
MKKLAAILALVMAGAVVAPGTAAAAATGCGTLITNVATVTMWSGPMDQIGYALSYNVTAVVKVVCPVTALLKFADRDTASAGSVVTFYVCVDNQRLSADGSVWNVTVTDRMPPGMSFVDWNANNYGGAVTWNAYNGVLTPGGWNATAAPVAGQGTPLYMRWQVAMIGPQKSACVTYRARIL